MSHVSPSRLPRLQFSLRGLLLFMLLVGAGIAIYRWPWEVEAISPEHAVRTITRYRRGWNGRPVKHGLEVMGDLQREGWERWYDEGDLRIEKSWGKGKVNSEAHYRDGKRHGRYWDSFGNEEGETHGEYRHGQKHGEWKFITANLIVREQWHDDKQHGRTTWETKSGRLLQSAEYERGRLTKWNDLPVVEELERWLLANVPDTELRQTLLTAVPDSSALKIKFMHYGDVAFRLRKLRQEQQEFVVHFERTLLNDTTDWSGRLIGEVLLQESLENWYVFAFRYNRLHVVPIHAKSFDWQDRTGVYDVQFETGSEQEAFWLQNIVVDPLLGEYSATRFRQILSNKNQTPITIDLSNVEDEVIPLLRTSPSRLTSWSPRIRRDLLGQHLNREGCYVEQEGNKLIIRRHKERK